MLGCCFHSFIFSNLIYFLTHELIINVLFSFQKLGNFPSMFPSLVSNLISLWWENLLLTWILLNLLTYFMHQYIVWLGKWSVCIWKNEYSTLWGHSLISVRSSWFSSTSLWLIFYIFTYIFKSFTLSVILSSLCCTNYSEGGLKSLSPVRALGSLPSNPFRWLFLWPLGVSSYTYTDQYSTSPELWNFLLFSPLLFFKLKYNWFTVIQEYSKVIYAYIFFLFQIFPLQIITRYGIPMQMVLVVYFMFGRVYPLVPSSQFTPPPFPFGNHEFVFFVKLFLFCL